MVDVDGGMFIRRTSWFIRNIVESSYEWNWEERMGRGERRER